MSVVARICLEMEETLCVKIPDHNPMRPAAERRRAEESKRRGVEESRSRNGNGREVASTGQRGAAAPREGGRLVVGMGAGMGGCEEAWIGLRMGVVLSEWRADVSRLWMVRQEVIASLGRGDVAGRGRAIPLHPPRPRALGA